MRYDGVVVGGGGGDSGGGERQVAGEAAGVEGEEGEGVERDLVGCLWNS